MKRFFVVIILIASGNLTFGQGWDDLIQAFDRAAANATYINYNNVIYRLNKSNNKAMVVNFKTNAAVVKIPSTFSYQGKQYTVNWIGYYDNDIEKREFDNARAKIVQLELPNNIKVVNLKNAFKGMVRLESLVVPPLDEIDDYNSLPYLPCLQKLIVRGNPKVNKYYIDGEHRIYEETRFVTADSLNIYDYNIPMNNNNYRYGRKDIDYISLVKTVITNTDNCPKLKTFSMPDAEKIIAQLKPRKNQYDKYKKQLSDYINMFESKLKENPFYDGEDSHFSLYELPMTYNYRNSQSTVDKEFAKSKKEIESEFNALINGEMKKNLKNNNPEKYISIVCSNNPKMAAKLDSVLKEYRCQSNKKLEISLAVIDGQKVSLQSCRESQYKSYSNMFESKDEFNDCYNKAKTDAAFISEIEKRQGIYKKLYGESIEDYENEYRIKYGQWFYDWKERADKEYNSLAVRRLKGLQPFLQRAGKNLDLKGAEVSSKENITYVIGIMKECKQTFFFNRALDMIFEYCPKVKKEYEATNMYFSSKDDFYSNYISAEYSKVLKDKKKEYKN